MRKLFCPIVTMALLEMGFAEPQKWESLWPAEAPGAAQPAAGSETVNKWLHYSDIEVPQYELYQPAEPNGMGLVIFPGGSYGFISAQNEGIDIAEWCVERGITAMIVKYRASPKAERGYQFPVPQLDARRAIRTMRYHADDWGLRAHRIGVIGASAGGHLAATCMTMFNDSFALETKDEIDLVDCRPDFGILMYPVIGMEQVSWAHGSSVSRLLGAEASDELRARCSPHLHVTAQTPPTFVVHSADDGGVSLRNATEFVNACAAKGVMVHADIYPTGGHGYGGKGRGAATGWMSRLDGWLESLPVGQ